MSQVVGPQAHANQARAGSPTDRAAGQPFNGDPRALTGVGIAPVAGAHTHSVSPGVFSAAAERQRPFSVAERATNVVRRQILAASLRALADEIETGHQALGMDAAVLIFASHDHPGIVVSSTPGLDGDKLLATITRAQTRLAIDLGDMR